MELRHLHYFLTLAEELSFVKAANKLCISQPPLSRQIRELEAELGTRLFDRNNKRVLLTEAGKYYANEVQQMMDSLATVNLQVKKIGDNLNGEFRIGYISSTYPAHVSKLIRFLTDKYPFVNFRLYEVDSSKQIAALEQGKLDMGIVRGPLKSPKVKSQVWYNDTYSIVYSKKLMTLPSEKNIPALKNQRFVFYNQSYAPHYHENLLQICAHFGFVPQVAHESNRVGSILNLVNEGLGVSILPTSVAKHTVYKDLSYLEIKSIKLYSDVLLASPKDAHAPIVKVAKDFLTGLIK